jgi:hypothetical protein
VIIHEEPRSSIPTPSAVESGSGQVPIRAKADGASPGAQGGSNLVTKNLS